MENKYYFLASALPELKLDYPPEITFNALDFLLKVNLIPEDYAKTRIIRLYDDIQNIRAFWVGEELDPRGYFNANELEEALLTQTGFPDYVYEFLNKYEQLDDRLRYFPSMLVSYFRDEIEKSEGFLKDYLIFEREWRLVFTGFRAKILGRDLETELQFEDPTDDIVVQILAQKDSKVYEPPARYSDLKALFEEHRDDPLALYRALSEFRFYKLEALYGIEMFSISRILAYMAQLMIVEKTFELDKKKGMEVVETIVKEAS